MITATVSNGTVVIGDRVAYGSKYFGVRACKVVKIRAAEGWGGSSKESIVVLPDGASPYYGKINLVRLDHVLKLN